LFVDDELQDEVYGEEFRSRMYGRSGTNMPPVKKLERHIDGTWQVICRIFIDNRLLFHRKSDAHAAQSAENNTAS